MNAEEKQVDVNLVVQALEMQRNRALTELAMTMARLAQVEKENQDLRAKLAEEKPKE